MLKFILERLIGKKTFISLALYLSHQVLKSTGIDIPDAELSQFLDTLLIILAGVFRYVGNKREAILKQDMESMSKTNKNLIDEVTKPIN